MSAEATAAVMASSAPLESPTGSASLPHDHQHCDNDDHGPQPVPDPDADIAHKPADYAKPRESPRPIGLHSPPDSNNAMKLDDSDDSELSDVEDPTLEPGQSEFADNQPTSEVPPEDEDIGEVTPDHWSGTVPVFKPDMYQFKDFKKFMEKVDSYGMKSGIIKIIPPQEWKDRLPPLDNLVKQIRVREPIKQDIMGSNGTYRQVNILHQRSYNLPQWRQLCDQSEHQPPARRGERRAQAPKPKASAASASSGLRRRGGGSATSTRSTRARRRGGARAGVEDSDERPMTPVSPSLSSAVLDSVEQEIGDDIEDDEPISRPSGRMGGMRQAKPKEQSTSARRKYARREGSARIDEEAFKDFDYQMDISDYTPERCEELERIYWKTLTYAPPLYGADVLGTLFDDSTECWNLNKLPNLLDVLGSKIPGVNTAYLYLGMWKATFAWHLEDVDLYSINYLHFGAPKQWYSISQGDARRFEAAMKSIWPTDAKACDQFLRHKAFLISPSHLQQYFNIKVNKCVSYPGEFVVTYPYGYHSGYNLGYNCAEAVNFALDSWLPMGKIAKKCECAQAQDSVWIDVYEIERKLRGEETDYEETDEEEDEDDGEEEDEDEEPEVELATPRSSRAIKFSTAGRKRKRVATEKTDKKKTKKIRLRLKSQVEPPCCLCPHDVPALELLPTEDGRKAHRLCALYGAETWIEEVNGKEIVANVANISKAFLDLKCLFCRSKRGTCFQCCHKKCARSYHATCAAAAGVLVEEAEVPVFGEDGTEYKEQVFEFSCRFHRTKRDRKLDGGVLDDCQKTRQAASALEKGEICQFQYHRGDIFAGIVVENRASEQTLLIDIMPNGDRVEVEWKWLLVPNPADLRLPHASPNAIPMPTSRKAKDLINATKRETEELPRAEEPFVDGGFVWAEFNHHELAANKAQTKVDLAKENQIWHYLGRNSTDARPQYTEDPRKQKHNVKSNFLDSVPRPAPPPPPPRKLYGSSFSIHTPVSTSKPEKPYQYKPRTPVPASFIHSAFTTQQFAPKPAPYTTQQFEPNKPFRAIFHHAQPPTKSPTPTTHQPPPIPSPLSYYRFQPPQYGPRGQSPQRSQQPQSQPRQQSVPVPQSQAQAPAQAQASYPPPQHQQQSYPAQYAQNTQHVHEAPPGQSTAQATPVQHEPRAPQTAPLYSSFRVTQPAQQAQRAQRATPQPNPVSTVQTAASGQHFYSSTPKPVTPVDPQPASTILPPNPSVATKQQPMSRRPSLPKATPTRDSSGHARSKSSVSSHSGRFALVSGQRFGTPPSSYGHARGDSMTKSPFSHGFSQPPGLGPSPSPQNGQLFQAQARARSNSLASNISLNTPMTSSAIRPPVSASAQALAGHLQSVISSNPPKEPKEPRASVTQKYAFFQVHHNRDSSKYKTPYAPWGGFTNGYEGNLRAHLMRTPDALFGVRRQSVGLGGVTPGLSAVPQQPFSGPSSSQAHSPSAQHIPHLGPPFGSQSAPPSASSSSTASEAVSCRSKSTSDFNDKTTKADGETTLHPAIRASYAAMVENRNVMVETQPSGGGAAHFLPTAPPSTPAHPLGRTGAEQAMQPKSSTPIPPPYIPTPSKAPQRAVTPASSVKSVVTPAKQTPIPAPRPWEALRKAQASAQLVQASTVPVTPNPSGLRVQAQPEPSKQLHVAGMQCSQVVQSADSGPSLGPVPGSSRLSPVQQQPQSTVAILPTPHTTQRLSPTDAMGATKSGAPVTPTVTPYSASFSATMATEPASPTGGAPDLPEVSDGSMELVESIIRNAQRASISFSNSLN